MLQLLAKDKRDNESFSFPEEMMRNMQPNF
jgi:hypothetical protein